jgi:hypothetical protein
MLFAFNITAKGPQRVIGMSRFSEKRLANEILRQTEMSNPGRRRRDLLVIVMTLSLGLLGNFVFNKIEVASALWFVALIAIGDMLLSFGPLVRIRALYRIFFVFLFALICLGVSFPFLNSQYCIQHAALTSGALVADDDGINHAGEKIEVKVGPIDEFVEPGGEAISSKGFVSVSDKVKVDRDKNGHIQISTTIRDPQGRLIVEINKNRWRVSDQKTECWDKNYTRDSLEVKDGAGSVILQVRLFPNKVIMQAIWNVEHVMMLDGPMEDGGIVPMFLYPSEEHWGEWRSQR